MSILAIVGPTASGKSRLAVEIAQGWGADVLGADASQVYRGMDIGTGKIRAEEKSGVEHHLLDLVDPDAAFDAAAYVKYADAQITASRGKGKRIILCGGTGLYLKALVNGLCEAPPVEDHIRKDLRSRIGAGNLAELYAELVRVDPIVAERIAPRDKQRIERALGVYQTTGRPLSAWQQEQAETAPRYDVFWLGIEWPRDVLNQRIEKRVETMFADGWVEEMRTLKRAGYEPGLNSMKALGYRFLSLYLDGELELDEARRKTVVATRKYAKRQMTWVRAMDGIQWFPGPVGGDDVADFLAANWGTGH